MLVFGMKDVKKILPELDEGFVDFVIEGGDVMVDDDCAFVIWDGTDGYHRELDIEECVIDDRMREAADSKLLSV